MCLFDFQQNCAWQCNNCTAKVRSLTERRWVFSECAGSVSQCSLNYLSAFIYIFRGLFLGSNDHVVVFWSTCCGNVDQWKPHKVAPCLLQLNDDQMYQHICLGCSRASLTVRFNWERSTWMCKVNWSINHQNWLSKSLCLTWGVKIVSLTFFNVHLASLSPQASFCRSSWT